MEGRDITVFKVNTAGLIAAHSLAAAADASLSDEQIMSFITINTFSAASSGAAVSYFETPTTPSSTISFSITTNTPIAGHSLSFINFTPATDAYFTNAKPVTTPTPSFTLGIKDGINVPEEGILVDYVIAFNLDYYPYSDPTKMVSLNFTVDPRIRIRHTLK